MRLISLQKAVLKICLDNVKHDISQNSVTGFVHAVGNEASASSIKAFKRKNSHTRA